MSAGTTNSALTVHRDLCELAPLFRLSVEAALYECEQAGLDAYVFEALRSKELQELYYARGRTIKPPERPVTNAKSNLWSWHAYGLAVDVISKSKHWDAGDKWFRDVAAIFKRHQCQSGIDWKNPDPPHHQWYKCKASPSDKARELLATGGLVAVWKAVGASE